MPAPSPGGRPNLLKRAFWFAYILFGIPLASHAQTYASCTASCTHQSTCQGPAGIVWGCVQSCYENCERMFPKTPLPPAPYGSIAFGDDGAEGMAWNQTNGAEADKVALGYCSKRGTNCQIVSRFENTCAALAHSDDSRHYETSTAGTTQQAEANAIAACRSRWGGKCSSDLSGCSYTDRHQPPPPPRATSWGAIAFSPSDGQAGWSQAKDDRASAEKAALSVCSQRGRSCVVVTAFNKQCGGLARDGSLYGWAVGEDQNAVLQQARDACAKNGGKRCVPQVLFCSR